MKSHSNTILILQLLVVFVFADGSNYETTNREEILGNSTVTNYSVSKFWCPERLQQSKTSHYCDSELVSDLPWSKLTCNTSSSICKSKHGYFSEQFLSCNKYRLKPDEVQVELGKGIVDGNGLLHSLGLYYVDVDNSVIVCGETPAACKPLPPDLLAVSRIAENGSVLIANLSIVLDDSRYFIKTSDGKSLEQICIPFAKAFIECKAKIRLNLEKEAWIQHDWTLLTDLNEKVPYDMYVLVNGNKQIGYCLPDKQSKNIAHVYAAATISSIFFLFVTLVLHQLVPVINTQNKPLLCHITSLMIAYTSLVVIQYGFPTDGIAHNRVACTAVYIVFHVFILAAFLWLNVTAFQMWRIFRKIGYGIRHQNNLKTFILNCLYAFGIPVIVCAITLAINWNDEWQKVLGINPMVDSFCMLNKSDNSLLILVYTPMSAILFGNALMFALTVNNLMETGGQTIFANRDAYKQILVTAIKLFCVMGLCWIMEVVSFVVGGQDHIWYFTDIINGLQGFFIFVIYVLKRSTFQAIRNKFF